MSTPTIPDQPVDDPFGLNRPQLQPQAPKKSRKVRRAIEVVAGAVVLVIALAVILSHISSGGTSGPALTPGSATVDQICQAQVGSSITNTLTGQNTNQTIVSAADGSVVSNLNASGNEVVTCSFTESTGEVFTATTTLFANGSTSWYGS